jgi:spore coat protein A, manganese oxidase
MVVTLTGFPAFAQFVPGGTLDPTTIPKYVIPLVIPPVMPASTASPAPAADYDIAVREFKQQILPGGVWNTVNGRADAFAATTVWSYGRAEDPLPDSSGIGGAAGVAPATNSTFNYPAFTLENTSNVATKVRWINDLVDPATGNYRSHLFLVDQTLHWANPPKSDCVMGAANRTDCETDVAPPYIGPVPLVTHVHGAHVQPHSDGYPEAWWLPAANNIPGGYATQGSRYGQADSTNVVPGSAFFAYENTQPASTIWYHDHALGMTRLNVYAGPAGFWLIRGGANGDANVTDGVALSPGVLPGPAPTIAGGDPNFVAAVRETIREIPIAIQDRSFNADGSLFYPPNRVFFDGFTGPYIGGSGTPAGHSDMSGIWNPEAFFNTMVVNGTTWPKFDVAPARYRFRLLDGCNSRALNLSMFVVTAGPDTVFGTADDVTTATEVPFYQIGAEQGFLPQVVKITKGFTTTLPGNGTTPAAVASASTEQGLFLMSAERADVIIDFSGMANGTRIRMFNTAPDSPFGGFPPGLVGYVPADPGTTGQVMDFVVNTALPAQPTDATSTPPENLVLPAAAPLGASTKTRQVSLNEMSSNQVCVEVNGIDGSIVGTLFSTFAGDPNFTANCAAFPVGAGNFPTPMGPRQAQLGVVTLSGANLVSVPTRWGDPITESPFLNTTETWEIYNTTVDGHPIHLHLVGFEVVNREDLDATALGLGNLVPTGVTYPPQPNERGYKDTVLALPGQITRIKAKFDIPGLYVWHCHIVEHEDNEMMRPLIVGADVLYANVGASGLYQWNGSVWTRINTGNPTSMVASDSVLYANFGAAGLYRWNGAWSRLNAGSPTSMVPSGSLLYANFGAAGLYQWNGTAWNRINTGSPTSMVASGSLLYANFGAAGLYQWNGTAWSRINSGSPTGMVASGTMLYASFGAAGLYKWNGTTWTRINAGSPTSMVASASLLYANFGASGLYQWNGTTWTRINTGSPTGMVASGTTLFASFGASGLYKWNGSSWARINPNPPASMIASGAILYTDYEGSGIWKWENNVWSKLSTMDPSAIAAGY